jgi:hypothetical protein
VAIGDGSRGTDLIVGLAKEFLCSAGMASKLVVVRPLCGADGIECCNDGFLGGGEIAVSLGINGGDWNLGGCYGRHDGCTSEQGHELD